MMYVFDNAAPEAHARLSALADVHDAGTIRHLLARGVTSGWRCLEIGGGLGTITRWISERVGPSGSVLTTDIDTRFLEALRLGNVEVRRHDVLIDPLPESAFDLAYARLVLEHLSDPDLALDRLAKAIKPGGWLIVQDMEILPPDPDAPEPVDRQWRTLVAMHGIAAAAGVHPRLGLSLGRLLRSRGLLHVGNEGNVRLHRGKSAAARLMRLNFQQLRERILASGFVSSDEFDADVARLDDEEFEWRSPILWTAWGQRPER
jgi:SAM-dependent methyltransferase